MSNNKPKSLAEIKQDLLAEMNANKTFMHDLHALGITDDILNNNVSFVYDYFKAKESVAKCVAAGKCLDDNYYHDLTIEVRGDFITTTPTVCPVYLQNQTLMSRFLFKDYPAGSLDINIGYLPVRQAFNAFRTELTLLIEGMRDMVFVTAKRNLGLLAEASAYLMQALRNNNEVTVGVIDFPRIVRELSHDIFNNKLVIEQYIDKLASVDYLVIDGIGNEETNSAIRDTIIFPLIQTRATLKRPTVFLSELTLDELSRLYDRSKNDVRVKQIINLIHDHIKREIIVTATSV